MSKVPFEIRYTPALRAAFSSHGIEPFAESILMHSFIPSGGRLAAILSVLDRIPDRGCTAEIGCANGGTSLMIGLCNGGREHWACDTFAGLADTGTHDDLKNGDFGSDRCTHEIVAERLLVCGNVRTVCGYFPEVAPAEMVNARYAFAHIDVDTYQSMHACYEFFARRMVPGGFIALDDVIGRGTRGAKRAWQEICASNGGRWRVISQNNPQVIIQFAA